VRKDLQLEVLSEKCRGMPNKPMLISGPQQARLGQKNPLSQIGQADKKNQVA